MYTITYNLMGSDGDSNGFYQQLKAFSDHAFRVLDEQFYDELLAYFRFRRHEDLEEIYSFEEGYLEMLALGIFWQVYSGDAAATDDTATKWIQKLTDLREASRSFKPLIDSVRGVMMTAVMQPDLFDHMSLAPLTQHNLKDLLDWLDATGEFKHEVVRLKYWQAYSESLNGEQFAHLMSLCLSGALWFEKEGDEWLGAYTLEVDRYLNEIRPQRYWKEDVIFCGRRRIEYHLNMLASQWLNQAYRQAYDQMPNHLLLLPTCMRIKSADTCMAKVEGEWLRCQHCDLLCQVSIASQLAEQAGTTTYMLPHSASLKAIPEAIDLSQTGVLGAACTLHLLAGGWMLANQGIPAQCIILDYCGCKQHWHPEGMPTALNVDRLKAILSRGQSSMGLVTGEIKDVQQIR